MNYSWETKDDIAFVSFLVESQVPRRTDIIDCPELLEVQEDNEKKLVPVIHEISEEQPKLIPYNPILSTSSDPIGAIIYDTEKEAPVDTFALNLELPEAQHVIDGKGQTEEAKVHAEEAHQYKGKNIVGSTLIDSSFSLANIPILESLHMQKFTSAVSLSPSAKNSHRHTIRVPRQKKDFNRTHLRQLPQRKKQHCGSRLHASSSHLHKEVIVDESNIRSSNSNEVTSDTSASVLNHKKTSSSKCIETTGSITLERDTSQGYEPSGVYRFPSSGSTNQEHSTRQRAAKFQQRIAAGLQPRCDDLTSCFKNDLPVTHTGLHKDPHKKHYMSRMPDSHLSTQPETIGAHADNLVELLKQVMLEDSSDESPAENSCCNDSLPGNSGGPNKKIPNMSLQYRGNLELSKKRAVVEKQQDCDNGRIILRCDPLTAQKHSSDHFSNHEQRLAHKLEINQLITQLATKLNGLRTEVTELRTLVFTMLGGEVLHPFKPNTHPESLNPNLCHSDLAKLIWSIVGEGSNSVKNFFAVYAQLDTAHHPSAFMEGYQDLLGTMLTKSVEKNIRTSLISENISLSHTQQTVKYQNPFSLPATLSMKYPFVWHVIEWIIRAAVWTSVVSSFELKEKVNEIQDTRVLPTGAFESESELTSSFANTSKIQRRFRRLRGNGWRSKLTSGNTGRVVSMTKLGGLRKKNRIQNCAPHSHCPTGQSHTQGTAYGSKNPFEYGLGEGHDDIKAALAGEKVKANHVKGNDKVQRNLRHLSSAEHDDPHRSMSSTGDLQNKNAASFSAASNLLSQQRAVSAFLLSSDMAIKPFEDSPDNSALLSSQLLLEQLNDTSNSIITSSCNAASYGNTWTPAGRLVSTSYSIKSGIDRSEDGLAFSSSDLQSFTSSVCDQYKQPQSNVYANFNWDNLDSTNTDKPKKSDRNVKQWIETQALMVRNKISEEKKKVLQLHLNSRDSPT